MVGVRILTLGALVAFLPAGCSSSDTTSNPPTRSSGASSRTGTRDSYGGLGATVEAFKKANNTIRGTDLALGVAYYSIDATSSGRVTAYSVEIKTKLRISNGDRVIRRSPRGPAYWLCSTTCSHLCAA